MRIVEITAKNFKALKAITLLKTNDINVIVGPNAIGKSTLLEIVRLVKTILAPRLQNEAQQALIQAGVLSPHHQVVGGPGLDFPALANDPTRAVVLTVGIELNEKDVTSLKANAGPLALMILQAEHGASDGSGPLAFTQYLSTAVGQKRATELTSEIASKLTAFSPSKQVKLSVTFDQQRTVRGGDDFSQAVIALLDRMLPNHLSLFSLFPADRALPQGDPNLQLGAGDAQQQLLSHLAQPAIKYSRLKQTIIQAIMLERDGRDVIENEFNLIFDNVLPGKKLAGVSFNELGLLKVLVRDEQSGKIFDVDQMSSGEKGLVLTFLFARLAVADGGVILIDEPELHLNSAVQSKILPFLLEHCVRKKSLQVFICTHSPEIVRDAFESEKSNLFHLRSGEDLTPVLEQDHQELFEIFDRLGSSAADVLFTKGNVYLEGPHDSLILQAGYPDLLNGYKLTAVGGRGEIEREAPLLQAQERAGKLTKSQLFILDNDRKPTGLASTDLVRIYQLNRYCIENFLLNDELLFDLIVTHAKKPVESRGQFPAVLRELALQQTYTLAIWQTYLEKNLQPKGLRRELFSGQTAQDVANQLASDLKLSSENLREFQQDKWADQFVERASVLQSELREDWSSTWRELCDGKALFDSLYVKYELSIKKIEFKKDLMRRMAQRKTDEWRVLNDVLSTELKLRKAI